MPYIFKFMAWLIISFLEDVFIVSVMTLVFSSISPKENVIGNTLT